MRAWLEFSNEKIPVHGSCAIGRLPENQVVLDGAQVSRRHALVQAHGESGFWLIDFGSSNGSLLNHRRVFEPTRLNDRDEIEISGHRLIFRQQRQATEGGAVYNAAAWKATECVTQIYASTSHAAILLDEQGNIATITPQARQWLGSYFKGGKEKVLPEKLRQWLKQQTLEVKDRAAAPPAEMVVPANNQKRLIVRLAEKNSPQKLLLMSEDQSVFSTELLQTLGLTAKESEVLYWLAEGKSNPEIGIILNASPRTVGKHVEHIFQKLGVETRTAALLYVVERLARKV